MADTNLADTTSGTTLPRSTFGDRQTDTPAPNNPQQPSPPQQNNPPAQVPPGGPSYKNCTEVRNAGKAPLLRGQPGYAPDLDRDNDGVACE
ncbi:excalibur calcium-binding domain-containing protein [Nocardia beijingensis]|uniref:excalibur calcium-binding domain-containing protein n=1 Tax=Nocardia beijingensis TaxID=95162 RepID=UPI003A5D1ED2